MSVFELCDQAIGLLRGKRLVLNADELTNLNALRPDLLTSNHAQDEAVVCAMHFERVRDRLQQMYPWVFARRDRSLGQFNREIPDDCLTVLCILDNDGQPMEYNALALNGDIPADAGKIIYTMRIEDITK